MKSSFVEWIRRYGVAELVSLVLGVVLTAGSYLLVGSIIGSAFFGSVVETVSFYFVIAYREVRHRKRKERDSFGLISIVKLFRNLLVEFGPAEYLDTVVIRPFWFSLFPLFITNYSFAIFLATIVADISFYVPVICSYELRKKYLKG